MPEPPARGPTERSVALIRSLLADPALRARFRAEPEAVCHEYDLPEMAAELVELPRGMMTLDVRESRSSLAGVMLAAAAEGIDFAHFAAQAAPDLEKDAAAAVHQVIHDTPGPARRAAPSAAAGAPPPAGPPIVNTPPSQPAAIPPLAPRREAPPDRAAAGGRGDAGLAGARAHSPKAGAERRGDATGAGVARPAGGGAVPAHGGASPDHSQGDPSAAAPPDLLPYPGDNAPPRRIAGWMAAHAARAGLPPELPVMAALTESGLHNTPTGDRDSVGFFQMRTSIWDSGRYAGFERRPDLQLRWFIDQALAVRGAHAKDRSYGRDSSSWGEWVADIEQPAGQYRGRYQLQLDSARELLRGLGLSASARSPAELAVHTALGFVGTPYVWGGSSPATGFDCSGLVQYAYGQAGVGLPRVADDQFARGTPVPRGELRRGDVVFFRDAGGVVHHEGIYVGGGRFVHAPRTGEDIQISSLDEPYFAAQYTGARRFAALSSMEDASRYARSLPTVSG